MNHIGLGSSSIGAECWPRRLEECHEDQQLLEAYRGSKTATLKDVSRLQNSRRCADTGKPVLRLRGGGSVPRKQGHRKSCGGSRIKPPAKRQRLAEAGNSTHEVRAVGLTRAGTGGLVVHNGRWLDGRLSVERGSLPGSDDRRILLAGEAQPIHGRELDLNLLICRLNVMAGWVPVAEAVTFDEHFGALRREMLHLSDLMVIELSRSITCYSSKPYIRLAKIN